MTSAHSSPLNGSDEVDGLEIQGKPLAPVPVIDLPHRWDESGNLVPGTSPSACRFCQWNGDPERFLDGSEYITAEHCMREPIKCASCEILRCILLKTAEVKGRPVTDISSVYGLHGPYKALTFDGLGDIWQSIFIDTHTPKSDIDRYNMTRRFMPSQDRLCNESSKWAQKRLAECAGSHELCQSQRSDSFLPTRLINLQPGWEGLDVRLEDNHFVPSGSFYTTLSYCWGSHIPGCITTVETLAQNKTRIPWDNLPLMFQDAAAFTLSLGVKYLWIDSICIIQGDEEDWQREAGKMYAVYKNSYLTLAALVGHDSTCGLRNMSVKQNSVLLAELRIAETKYPLYMRRSHYLDSVTRENIKESSADIRSWYPLLSRAWAYQERTVSARVIFFTESEMIFQCLKNADCECGATQEYFRGNAAQLSKTDIFLKSRTQSWATRSFEGNRSAENKLLHMSAISSLITTMKHLPSILSEDNTRADGRRARARQAAVTWRHHVVCEYSVLAITMPRDRLPAVGAIAEQFHRVRVGEVYLAGLWSGSLLDDLLWRSAHRALDVVSHKSKENLERLPSLPTWSWASLKCSIIYPSDGITVHKAEVLEANCSYMGDNAFGVLRSSKLVLRGRVLHSQLIWTGADVSICFLNGDSWTEFSDSIEGMRRALWVCMDRDQDGFQSIPSRQEIDVLEISISTSDSSQVSEWHFLLLRRKDTDECVYTRAGKATYFLMQEESGGADEGESPQDGFRSVFESQSVLTTCEIR